MGRFLAKLDQGIRAIGSTDSIGSERLAEAMAFAGIDVLMVDQMFCPADWSAVSNIARAAHAFDTDVLVRIQSFPWGGVSDARTAADAARALGVGADGVVVSCSTAAECEMVLAVASDWHRDIHLHPFDDANFAEYEKSRGKTSIVMPMIESRSAMDDLPKILALDGLSVLTLGLTDLTRMVGKPFQYEDDEVVRYANEIIEECHRRHVRVGANVGYTDSRDLSLMAERIRRMTAQGYDFIWLQNNGFVIQWMYRSLLDDISAE